VPAVPSTTFGISESATHRPLAVSKHNYVTVKQNTVGYARKNVIGSRTSFLLAYIEIYVFRGNPFQAHSLEQNYHPTQPFKQEKYNTISWLK